MRKKLIIVLTMLMAVSLVACSSSKLNDNNTRTAKAVINAVDAYLDGTADIRTTYNAVQAEESNIDESDEEYLYFSIDVTSLCVELNPTVGLQDVSEITDYRNDIADMIGVAKYK